MAPTRDRSTDLLLPAALLIGGALRLWASTQSIGFDHPNEIYRLLEPLAELRGYSSRPAWEWSEGLLSRLPILAHDQLLRASEALGARLPLAQAGFLRAAYALLGLLPIWAAHRIALGARGGRLAAGLAALWVALWPEFVYRSVRLMDYALEAALLAFAAGLLLGPRPAGGRMRMPLAGAALGALFFLRPQQAGLYGIALAVAAMLPAGGQEIPSRASPGRWVGLRGRVPWALLAGFVAALALLGAVEPGAGGWLRPAARYLVWNVRHSAKAYGADPWHRYLSELAKIYGFVPLIPLLAAALRRGRRDWRPVALFLVPLAVLTLVSHKEERFLFGFAWLLVPAALSGDWSRWRERLASPAARRAAIAGGAALALAGAAVNLPRIADRFYTHAVDMRSWQELGFELARGDRPRRPLTVHADPDFVPGAFFLRHRGPLCYHSPRGWEGQCDRPTGSLREIQIVIRPESEGGGWKLTD